VTPSGAAILVAHDTTYGPVPEMTLLASGIGGGRRRSERPNICRVLIGEAVDASGPLVEVCVLLEANIDDQTPEFVGHAIERLVAEGALDAWVQPIVMKKSRPAFLVSVLVRPDDEERISARMFHLTTTLGLRRRTSTRYALDRERLTVEVEGHEVRVKVGRLGTDVTNVAPEFADCVTVADATGIRPTDIYERATALAHAQLARA
ncbi:MAG: LarC family nickel insertion protein, partial [Actinomycetota bacterium]